MAKKPSTIQLILAQLLKDRYKTYTIRELARTINKDYKNVYEALKAHPESIRKRTIGHSAEIQFAPHITSELIAAELTRVKAITKKLNLLVQDINNLDEPLCPIILFGSYAKDNEHKNSDIDICIIHNNEKEAQRIELNLSIHPNIEIHTFHYSEFIRMMIDNTFNVGHEIARTGIPLRNIESYYKVLQDGWKTSGTSETKHE
ncbi:MAG: nucleotidyltransferase domain-containing protein [Candidatus Woesearchaeota archaeon]